MASYDERLSRVERSLAPVDEISAANNKLLAHATDEELRALDRVLDAEMAGGFAESDDLDVTLGWLRRAAAAEPAAWGVIGEVEPWEI